MYYILTDLGFVFTDDEHTGFTYLLESATHYDRWLEAEEVAKLVGRDYHIMQEAPKCPDHEREHPDHYTLYWLGGRRQVIDGHGTFGASMMQAGYGGGALRALDFYANGDDNSYVYENGDWNKRKEIDNAN